MYPQRGAQSKNCRKITKTDCGAREIRYFASDGLLKYMKCDLIVESLASALLT